jgi:hypothetical protein
MIAMCGPLSYLIATGLLAILGFWVGARAARKPR